MRHLEADRAIKTRLERTGSEAEFAEAAVSALKLMGALLHASAELGEIRSAA